MRTFTRKGYGRIYVDKSENIEALKQIIKEMDEFEFHYMPKDFIAPFSEYPNIIYTHKFDALDINKLTAKCWKAGIYLFCLDNWQSEYILEEVENA